MRAKQMSENTGRTGEGNRWEIEASRTFSEAAKTVRRPWHMTVLLELFLLLFICTGLETGQVIFINCSYIIIQADISVQL